MAVHSISTPVPAPQRGLLRAFAHTDALPKSWDRNSIGNSDFVANHPDESGSVAARALAAPDSTAAQPCNASGLAPEEALASTALHALFEPAEAAEARALYSRRRLGEALEYGFALLDALDLPPLALDVIDDAIAALDALDAAGEDMEEDDPAEETSLETAGRGLVRCGADDDEDECSDEDDELGDEHAPEHAVWMFGPKLNARVERQNFAVWLAAAEVTHV